MIKKKKKEKRCLCKSIARMNRKEIVQRRREREKKGKTKGRKKEMKKDKPAGSAR